MTEVKKQAPDDNSTQRREIFSGNKEGSLPKGKVPDAWFVLILTLDGLPEHMTEPLLLDLQSQHG